MRAPASDAAAVAELASTVGRVLLSVREVHRDLGAVDLKDLGDRSAQVVIDEWLAGRFPDDAVLSEEAADDPARLGADRVWIVDPLDGTREYSEPPRTDWAVHVALWERGELVAGAVALPAVDTVLSSAEVPHLGELAAGRPRIVVSRSRPPGFVRQLCAGLGGELVEMGSAGAKAMAVVQGAAEVYAHAGGQYEWDSAAPVAVARAAGAHTSRIDGSPLMYNRPNPWLPDLLICHPDLAQKVLAILGDLGTTTSSTEGRGRSPSC